jgi:hypothetical protein
MDGRRSDRNMLLRIFCEKNTINTEVLLLVGDLSNARKVEHIK